MLKFLEPLFQSLKVPLGFLEALFQSLRVLPDSLEALHESLKALFQSLTALLRNLRPQFEEPALLRGFLADDGLQCRTPDNIRSMTHVVLAALSPMLGQLPTPFSAFTTVWMSGCCM